MILKLLSPRVFETQADFIRIMDANRDFAFWGETLVPEEMKELKAAHEEGEGISQIFKETADLIYVMAGFFNTMPNNIYAVLDNARAVKISETMMEAEQLLGYISTTYKISPMMMERAFDAVHASNLSKLDDEGKPIRREDGKILKGPNYKAPDMQPLANEWQAILEQNV